MEKPRGYPVTHDDPEHHHLPGRLRCLGHDDGRGHVGDLPHRGGRALLGLPLHLEEMVRGTKRRTEREGEGDIDVSWRLSVKTHLGCVELDKVSNLRRI